MKYCINNFLHLEELSNQPGAFVIKTELTNATKPVLQFSFEIDNEGLGAVTPPFGDSIESHLPLFSEVVSDGKRECSLLMHILEKASQAGINVEGADLRYVFEQKHGGN